MIKHSLNIIAKIYSYANKNKKIVFPIIIAIIIARFLWLNYSNYQTGNISNGIPGIKLWLDSGRYIEGANKILDKISLIGRELQFIGYMLVIAFTKLMGLPLGSVLIIQIGFAILSAFALYDIAIKISNSKIAGITAMALYLCNPFITSWHMYILTESLYTSFVILSLWCLIRLLQSKNIIDLAYSIPIFLMTMLIRPNGWILLPIWIICIIIRFPKQKKWKAFFSGFVFILFIFSMSSIGIFNKSIQITTPVKNLKQGITVWGHEELSLEMPQDVDIDDNNWINGVKYIFRHPLPCAKLAICRVSYTLVHIRPYHSTKYKIRVLIWIIPAYILTFISLLYYKKNKIVLISIIYIVSHLFVVALSYAEHDSRFDIYILPMFYLLAGLGTYKLLKHIKIKLLISL